MLKKGVIPKISVSMYQFILFCRWINAQKYTSLCTPESFENLSYVKMLPIYNTLRETMKTQNKIFFFFSRYKK